MNEVLKDTRAASAGTRIASLVIVSLALTACGSGGGGNNGGGNPATVTVSGTVNYEFVPANANCNGLDFAATFDRPIRGATVQLLDSATGSVISATASDDLGAYSFTGVSTNTLVRLRIRAELKRLGQGLPSWDVEVRDNVDTSASPPALGSRPLYVLDGSEFDTGSANVTRSLTALTGWGGSSYTGTRSAAPFAVLDAIYAAMQFIVTADGSANFPPLDAFWSVNNTSSDTEFNLDTGEGAGTFYFTGLDMLFLLGDESDDTDEFDEHIVVHEWGHFFDDNLSRSDSIGGTHFLGDVLDPRLAFGEGFASALAAMALDDPRICSTGAAGTTAGFEINAEGGAFGGQGWYDEVSVIRFIYDLWDTASEGTDTGSIGFAPIYNTMVGPQVSTEAFTTIFSFATELRSVLDATGQALLDAQLGDEQIDATVLNIWGDNETNVAGAVQDVSPIYTDFTADGTILNICSNSQFDPGRDGNKVSEDRYLRIAVPVTDQYNVIMATTTATPVTPDPDDRDQSDPDIYIYQGAQLVSSGLSSVDNLETFLTSTLTAGQTYIASVEDWRFDDEGASTSYPERICFDISFNPTP